jgi:endonuclease YncB( thermonuclease family)
MIDRILCYIDLMKRLTREKLIKMGIPGALATGMAAAILLGWKPELLKFGNFGSLRQIFSNQTTVEKVIDGDSLTIKNGMEIRLLGINAPEENTEGFEEAKEKLIQLTANKKIYLEYDREQDDQYGRILAWVWVDCESRPKFLPADYMYLNKRQSKPGLTENPEGCKEGKLVNEAMVDSGLAELQKYKDVGESKYEGRLTEE